jgi:hypothetical protein
MPVLVLVLKESQQRKLENILASPSTVPSLEISTVSAFIVLFYHF